MSQDPLSNFPVLLYDPKQSREIPETQVVSVNDEYIDYELFGDRIEITGGFMEPIKHGDKKQQANVIFGNDPNTIVSGASHLCSK